MRSRRRTHASSRPTSTAAPASGRTPSPSGTGRLVAKLGIQSHIHALRHYSATELINAGVDVRTVAGRLGHGGGGTTTLKVYGGVAVRIGPAGGINALGSDAASAAHTDRASGASQSVHGDCGRDAN